MPASLAVLFVFGGSLYLVMGGDLLVRGATALSRRLGISPMVVGLTVVALGTSAPELVVSVRAAATGYPELAIANVVGSNIANVLLVLGVPALLSPLACGGKGVGRDGLFMLFATALFTVLCYTGSIGPVEGGVLLAGLVLFAVHVLRASTLKNVWATESKELPWILGLPSRPAMIGTFIVLGILWLPLGAELLIRGAVRISELLGIPSAVVGLTLVALSTSLPELATSVVAVFKRETEVAVGNVLGSNVMNVFAIMGAAALWSPASIQVPPRFRTLDLPVMVATAVLLTVLAVRGRTISRGLGGTMVGAYLAYLVVLFTTG